MNAVCHHRMTHKPARPALSVRERETLIVWARDAGAGLAFMVFVASLLFGLG